MSKWLLGHIGFEGELIRWHRFAEWWVRVWLKWWSVVVVVAEMRVSHGDEGLTDITGEPNDFV